MSYDARSRDKHRRTVAVITGAMTVGAISATGWLAGNAARDYEREQAERQAAEEKERARYERRLAASREQNRPVRERPTRTRVTTRYISGGTPSAPVVDSPPASDPAPQPAPAPAPAAPPPAPAPEPPPAPSSGS